ncbi:MAG: DUF4465 domain-containing protein [Planctomycetota bacterium]
MKINFKHMSAKAWFTNIIMFVCACFLFSPQAYSATVDFSDLTLAPESYWNGSDNSGGFSSGGAFFNNSYYYDSTYNYESWSGWAQSNITNNTTSGYTNQYSAITGGGVHGPGSNYVLADDFDPNDSYINLPVGKRADALVVTNSTYAYYSMLNGDSFAKKFTSTDWFKLTITGYSGGSATGNQTGSVDFYLAQNSSIVNSWKTVSLLSLGLGTQSLGFQLASTDNGTYGMNTPAYFAVGALEISSVPEPSTMILCLVGAGAWLIVRRSRRTY